MSLHSGQNLTAGHLSDLLGGKTKASPKKRKQKETQPKETQPEVTQPEGTQPVQPRAGAKGGNKKKKVNLALKSQGEKRIAPPSIFDDLPADAFDDSPKKTQPEETQPEETEGETIEMDAQATAVSHVQVCEVAMADVHGTSFFDGALPVSGAFDVEDLVGKYIYIPKNFFAKR